MPVHFLQRFGFYNSLLSKWKSVAPRNEAIIHSECANQGL